MRCFSLPIPVFIKSAVFASASFVAMLCVFTGTGVRAQEPSAATKTPPPANESKGMPPRTAPGDYAAQAVAGTVTIAADFMGHSVPRVEGPLDTEDYVVVETGFFGPPGARLKLSVDDFSLRINGKKNPLSSQRYGMVQATLKDPAWIPPEPPAPKSKSGLNTGGGGDSGPPLPPKMPFELRRAMALYLQQVALPEGDRALPQAGLIFFQYRGKTQSIRSMELIYSGEAGKATLTLNP
jgi:hypothetical protein